MRLEEVMTQLAAWGNDGTKKVLSRHGAREPFFGVKVQDLKKIQKKVKKDHQLAQQLWATGNSDAMYLAGLIADENQVTKAELERWADEAYWYYLSEYTVAWVAGDSPFGEEMGLAWIESQEERIASAGWATLAYLTALKPDDELDLALYQRLLERVATHLPESQNRVRYAMNGFVIAVGSNVVPLHDQAMEIAGKVGKVDVEMGGTACKVPLATAYIDKVAKRGSVGKKRKSARK